MKIAREDKIDKILQAAREVFRQHGPRKTTLDDIASSADISKTSIYYYFNSKEEILHAIFTMEIGELEAALEKAVAAAPTTFEKLKAFIDARYGFIMSRTSMISQEVLWDFRNSRGQLEFERPVRINTEKELLKRILIEGMAKEDLRHFDDVDHVAFMMIASLLGIDRHIIFSEQRDKFTEVIAGMADMLFNGIKKAE